MIKCREKKGVTSPSSAVRSSLDDRIMNVVCDSQSEKEKKKKNAGDDDMMMVMDVDTTWSPVAEAPPLQRAPEYRCS